MPVNSGGFAIHLRRPWNIACRLFIHEPTALRQTSLGSISWNFAPTYAPNDQRTVSDRVHDGYPHKVDPQDVRPRCAKLLSRQLLTPIWSRRARPWQWASLAPTVQSEANRLQLRSLPALDASAGAVKMLAQTPNTAAPKKRPLAERNVKEPVEPSQALAIEKAWSTIVPPRPAIAALSPIGIIDP